MCVCVCARDAVSVCAYTYSCLCPVFAFLCIIRVYITMINFIVIFTFNAFLNYGFFLLSFARSLFRLLSPGVCVNIHVCVCARGYICIERV